MSGNGNGKVQVDGIYDFLKTTKIDIGTGLRWPITNNILTEPVQQERSVIYETVSGSLYYSQGNAWTPVVSAGGGITNIGVGTGIYKQTVSGTAQLRSIQSTDSTVTVTPGDTINLRTSLPAIRPVTGTGDIIYANTGSTYSNLPIAVAGLVLTSDGTKPVWSPIGSNANTMLVSPNPGIGQFANIYSAMASIPVVGPAAASVTNPYVIYVNAGLYREPGTVVFKDYVYVVGEDIGGVIVEPLTPGFDLFVFARATAISFLSIQNVAFPNYGCILRNAGTVGYEFQLLHKVNFYDTRVLCDSTATDSFIYFEYVSFTNSGIVNNVTVNSSPGFSTYLSTENFFIVGPSTDALLVDGPNSFLSGQACNMQGDGIGNCCVIVNGGHLDLRDTFIAFYGNGVLSRGTSASPGSAELSGITFSGNTLNINIETANTTGYFSGFSEYNKTVINPAGTCTFFIVNSSQNIVTVAGKGGNFTDLATAVLAINPQITIGIVNLSTGITSAGLFTAALDTIPISAAGIPPGTTCTFVDINNMTLSAPATATATVIGTFLRASQTTPYIVSILPGTYLVPPIIVYEYLSVIGVNRDTCILVASTPGSVFNMLNNSSIQNLTITGVSATVYAITTNNPHLTTVNNILFLNVAKGILFSGMTADFSTSIYDCIFISLPVVVPGDIAINILNPLGYNIILDINNVQCVQHFNNFFVCSGPQTKVSIRNCALGGDGTGNVLSQLNGCIVNVQGLYVINWATVFSSGDNVPNFPYLAVVGFTSLGVSGNILNITNVTATGHFSGYIEYTKVNINPVNAFFIVDKNTNIVTVAKKGGDFTSIRAAVLAVSGSASPTNIYVVAVGPGIFTEDPITLVSYIDIRGSGYLATKINANLGTAALLTGADSTTVEHCTFTGATGVGGCALAFSGTGTAPGSPFIVNNCVLANNETLVRVSTTVNSALMILNGCLYGSSFNANNGITVTSTAGQMTSLLLYNCVFQDLINPVPQTLLFADGPGALIAASNVLVQLNGTNTSAALRIQNGATARVYGSTFIGLMNGVVTENVGVGPSLTIASTTFEDCDTIIAVNNPGTTGFFSGSIDITKTFIHNQASFFIRDRYPRVLVVSNRGSDFSTIASAIAFVNPTVSMTTGIGSGLVTSAGLFNVSMHLSVIVSVNVPPGSVFTFVDASNGSISILATGTGTAPAQFIKATSTTPYTIEVQPGLYTEPALILPEYVCLTGTNTFSCIINPADTTGTLLTIKKNAYASGLTLSGVTTGTCIKVDSTQVLSNSPIPTLTDIHLQASKTGIFVTSTTSVCEAVISDILIENCTLYGIHVDGLLANTVAGVTLHLNTLTCENTLNGIFVEGPNARCVLSATIIDCEGVLGSSGILVSDGCELTTLSAEIREAGVALNNPNTGAGCLVTASGLVCRMNTQDILIANPATNGCLSMPIAERSKVNVNVMSPITVSFVDPVVNGTAAIGALYVGHTNSQATDISELLQHGFGMGRIDGGEMTDAGGLFLNIALGDGYITQGSPPIHYIQKVEFIATVLPLAASSTLYIYVESGGVITSNVVQPDPISVVLLGRVTTDATGIEIIEHTQVDSSFISNKFDKFHRNAIGAVVANGLSVACSVTRELTIGSGRYYYSGVEFNPSGSGPPAVYYQYNHVAGVFAHALGASSLQNTDYDNGVGLTPIPLLQYIKNTLFLTGDSTSQKAMLVISQTTFATLPDATAGNSPTPPTYFSESIIPIADIILRQGDATFSSIIDRRPVITSSLSSVASTLVHGNLLGLGADDHLQYLLTNGTRVLTGPQDFGGFNLTNTGTINGISLAAHASRHLPNGLDPLATAAPLVTLSATTANGVGTANSFARSDHTHAITTSSASTLTPDLVNATGISANLARADHIHNIPSGTPVSVGSANAAGAAASFSKSDHIHQGIHSLNVNAGTARYGDITVQQGLGVSIADNGAGVFTVGAESGLNEFYPSIGVGLNVAYTTGKLNISGTVITVAGGNVLVPAFSSGFIYITQAGVVTFTLGSMPRNSYPVASFVSGGAAVTSVIDLRTYINSGISLGSGKTIIVDQTLGNDTTGARQGTAFATIAAAIAVALSGDLILMYPGTYNETGLVLPTGVCIRGICAISSVISYTATTSTTIMTVGLDSAVANLTISLTSSTTGLILTGILFPGTTTVSATINTVRVSVNNTTSGIANVYGIRANSTGVSTFINTVNTGVIVSSQNATSGIIRGIYNDNSGTFSGFGVSITTVSGTLVDVGVETAHASAIINMYNSIIKTSVGETFIATLGTVNLYNTVNTAGKVINSKTSAQLEFGSGNTTTVSAPVPASDITLTLPITADTLTGRDTTDTFTNKTITSNTNTVYTDALKTTGAAVSVVSAAPPTVGQALIATSATAATWQAVSTGNFIDTSTFIIGSVTPSKRLGFDCSLATASTTTTLSLSQTANRVLTLPDITDIIVTKTSVDILTNKTLNLPVISSIVNTGTLTLPTTSDTLLGRNTVDTLTNKTLTSARVNQLLDTLGNVSLVISPVASAVNQLTISGGALGVSPSLAVTGTDTNINMNLQAKGTGVYNLNATATAAAEVRLFEVTGSGTNYTALRAGAPAANVTLTLPVTVGTVGQALTTDGTGVLSFTSSGVAKATFCFASLITASLNAAFPATTAGAAYFGWKHSDYSGFTSGKVTYRLQTVSSPAFDIRLYDFTNNVVLGSDLGVVTPGTRTFTIINPTADAVLVFQVRKATTGGVSPIVMGLQWEWVM